MGGAVLPRPGGTDEAGVEPLPASRGEPSSTKGNGAPLEVTSGTTGRAGVPFEDGSALCARRTPVGPGNGRQASIGVRAGEDDFSRMSEWPGAVVHLGGRLGAGPGGAAEESAAECAESGECGEDSA